MQTIDLRSDTITRPSPEMLKAMMTAKVGDDVFGDDPTVIALEEKAAQMFGKEAALYCPSDTMTNQIAIQNLAMRWSATAGIYALENNIERLKEDHSRAKQFGEILGNQPYVKNVMPVDTNIVVIEIVDEVNSEILISELAAKGILVVGFGKQKIRLVMHLDFDDEMLKLFAEKL